MQWIILGGIVFVIVSFLFIYNSLISHRNSADNAFSTIDIMLKKRWDLIPNLVAATKGYMTHEASLLERLTKLRSTAIAAAGFSGERMAAEGEISGCLSQFRAVAESYPNLKANDQFLFLQASLNECEEQLSAARRAFNAAILQYNNSVEMFPHSLVANLFQFRSRAFFEIIESERANPNIKQQLS